MKITVANYKQVKKSKPTSVNYLKLQTNNRVVTEPTQISNHFIDYFPTIAERTIQGINKIIPHKTFPKSQTSPSISTQSHVKRSYKP